MVKVMNSRTQLAFEMDIDEARVMLQKYPYLVLVGANEAEKALVLSPAADTDEAAILGGAPNTAPRAAATPHAPEVAYAFYRSEVNDTDTDFSTSAPEPQTSAGLTEFQNAPRRRGRPTSAGRRSCESQPAPTRRAKGVKTKTEKAL